MYIWQDSPLAAIRFLDAAEATFHQIAASPRIGTCYDTENPALAEIRFLPITRFRNDLIFYRPLTNGIEVFRVLHGAQDIPRILAEEFESGESSD